MRTALVVISSSEDLNILISVKLSREGAFRRALEKSRYGDSVIRRRFADKGYELNSQFGMLVA